MKKHWTYLKYLLRHKWYVAVFMLKDGPLNWDVIWRAIIHDWSKFLPSEWFPYVESFYGPQAKMSKEEIADYERVGRNLGLTLKPLARIREEFNVAWNHHQKRNRHHWQYWMLTFDKGNTECLPMPEKYIWEMIADWKSAGYCLTGKLEYAEWYRKNRENIKLHPKTRIRVDWLVLGILSPDVGNF